MSVKTYNIEECISEYRKSKRKCRIAGTTIEFKTPFYYFMEELINTIMDIRFELELIKKEFSEEDVEQARNKEFEVWKEKYEIRIGGEKIYPLYFNETVALDAFTAGMAVTQKRVEELEAEIKIRDKAIEQYIKDIDSYDETGKLAFEYRAEQKKKIEELENILRDILNTKGVISVIRSDNTKEYTSPIFYQAEQLLSRKKGE